MARPSTQGKEKSMFKLSTMTTLAAAVAITGCGATLPQLRTRASVDLSCTPESLQMQPLDGATEIVTGCGKRALYVQLFNNSRYPTWLLNSNIEPAGVPPSAQSAR
jgi:hypothetical protein